MVSLIQILKFLCICEADRVAADNSYDTPTHESPFGTRTLPSIPNRYEVLAVLGSGGVGVVCKARDTVLDKTVAVKILHDSASGDARTQAIRTH